MHNKDCNHNPRDLKLNYNYNFRSRVSPLPKSPPPRNNYLKSQLFSPRFMMSKNYEPVSNRYTPRLGSFRSQDHINYTRLSKQKLSNKRNQNQRYQEFVHSKHQNIQNKEHLKQRDNQRLYKTRSFQHLNYKPQRQEDFLETSIIKRLQNRQSKLIDYNYPRSLSQTNFRKSSSGQFSYRNKLRDIQTEILIGRNKNSKYFDRKLTDYNLRKFKSALKTPYTRTPKVAFEMQQRDWKKSRNNFKSRDNQDIRIISNYENKPLASKHVASTKDITQKPFWFKSRTDNKYDQNDLKERIHRLLKNS